MTRPVVVVHDGELGDLEGGRGKLAVQAPTSNPRLQIITRQIKNIRDHFHWKCNFPMTPPIRPLVGQSVAFFPKRGGSYTSMLLSEHLFLSHLLDATYVHFRLFLHF